MIQYTMYYYIAFLEGISMKKAYHTVEVMLISLEAQDVITASGADESEYVELDPDL